MDIKRTKEIPESLTSIGAYAFYYSGLSKITFLGDAPSISGDSFSKLTVTAYYPEAKNWSSLTLRDYGGTITWIKVCSKHQWNAAYTIDEPATCTKEGVESIRCSVCNAMREGSSRVLAKTDHKWDSGIVTMKSTCTAEGIKSYSCIVCSETKMETIPMTDHIPVVVKGKAATTTSTGLTDGSNCSVCGKVLKAQTKIDKLSKKANPLKVKISKKIYTNKKLKKAATFIIGATKAKGKAHMH